MDFISSFSHPLLKPKLPSSEISLNEIGLTDKSSCGYCHKNSQVSCGFVSHRFSSSDYEALMDLGWRRCGEYYYRPILEKNCCRNYTIRLKVDEFVEDRKMRKLRRDFEKFIAESQSFDDLLERLQEKEKEKNQHKKSLDDGKAKSTDQKSETKTRSDEMGDKILEIILENLLTIIQFSVESGLVDESFLKSENLNSAKSKLRVYVRHNKLEFLHYSNLFQLLRLSPENALKLFGKFEPNFKELFPNSELFCDNSGFICFKDPSIQEIPALTKRSPSTRNSALEPHTSLSPEAISASFKSKFSTKLTLATSTKEKYQMYRDYCIAIHDKRNSESSFASFLCDSSLVNKGQELGSFHLELYLFGKLAGVSVIDLTPKVCSSVYFFHHPALACLRFGKTSTLFDIDFIKAHRAVNPNLEYYYLGYYIPDCDKMSYKSEFMPAQLLCQRSLRFVYLHDIKDKVKQLQRFFIDEDGRPFKSADEVRKYLLQSNGILAKFARVPVLCQFFLDTCFGPSLLNNIEFTI